MVVQVLEPGIPTDKCMKLFIKIKKKKKKDSNFIVILHLQKGLEQVRTFGMRGGGPDCSVETVTDGAGTIGSDSLLDKHSTILQNTYFLGKQMEMSK